MALNTETETVVGVAHPLDPLSRAEISRTAIPCGKDRR